MGWGLPLGSKDSSQEKRPRHGTEEIENKQKHSRYCLSLHLPAKIFRTDNHHFPLTSESDASSSFHCSQNYTGKGVMRNIVTRLTNLCIGQFSVFSKRVLPGMVGVGNHVTRRIVL